jgi:hypothetical protein
MPAAGLIERPAAIWQAPRPVRGRAQIVETAQYILQIAQRSLRRASPVFRNKGGHEFGAIAHFLGGDTQRWRWPSDGGQVFRGGAAECLSASDDLQMCAMGHLARSAIKSLAVAPPSSPATGPGAA